MTSEQQIANMDLLGRVEVESEIRPVTTTGYHKGYQEQPFDFPKLYEVSPTFPVMLFNPPSSYTMDRNERFAERYANVKNPM